MSDTNLDLERLRDRVGKIENYAKIILGVAAVFGISGGVGATMISSARSDITEMRKSTKKLTTIVTDTEAAIDAMVQEAKSDIWEQAQRAEADAIEDIKEHARQAGLSVQSVNGEPRRIVGGSTSPGNTSWKNYGNDHALAVHIDVSSAGFKKTPAYIFSVAGKQHWTTRTSVYSATKDGFDAVVFADEPMQADQANSGKKRWHVNWVAIGR